MIYNVVMTDTDWDGFVVFTEIIAAFHSKMAAEKYAIELTSYIGPALIKIIETKYYD